MNAFILAMLDSRQQIDIKRIIFIKKHKSICAIQDFFVTSRPEMRNVRILAHMCTHELIIANNV